MGKKKVESLHPPSPMEFKLTKASSSANDLEKKVPELLGGYKGKAILSPPEIALDIDKPRHLKALWNNY